MSGSCLQQHTVPAATSRLQCLPPSECCSNVHAALVSTSRGVHAHHCEALTSCVPHAPLRSPTKQVRVVSMPITELFDEQPESYRNSVLPEDVPARVTVEAGSTYGWIKCARMLLSSCRGA